MDAMAPVFQRDVVKMASGTGAANAAVVVTLAASAGVRHVLDAIMFAYSGSPTNGSFTVAIGGTSHGPFPVTQSGPGVVQFRFSDDGGLVGSDGQAITVTLAAGGAGVTGAVMVHYR